MSSGRRHGPSRSMMLVIVTSPILSVCMLSAPVEGRLFRPNYLHRAIAAIHQHVGSGHEARRIARQEKRGLRNLVGLAQPVEQVLRSCGASRLVHRTETVDQAVR